MSILRLAIPTPLRRLFDYLPPPAMSAREAASLARGVRLEVPFGSRRVTGVLVSVAEQAELPREQLKHALTLLDSAPLPDPQLLDLCLWAADYYHHPVGEVLCLAFPPQLRRGRAHLPAGEPGWTLNARGSGLPAGALPRSPKQSLALELLRRGPMGNGGLRRHGISAAVVRSLRDKELIEPCILPPAEHAPRARAGLPLNRDQQRAVEEMTRSLGQFQCHLLEGITGSGKTEVYLQLIAACLARGRQALVLIPEIGLTPQTLARFEQRFEAEIVVFHSGLSDAQRYTAWEAARSGRAHIVIGTRSAVFTPLAQPGVIVVDEEHDLAFKQQDGFRYSARDVAVKRAQLQGCPIILGSATPSLESLNNALAGRYQHHHLTHRAGSGDLPQMRILDIRRQPLRGGLSPPLLELLQQTLARGEQALLFLNRRGYAPSLTCHDCGWTAQCGDCDARLTLHRQRGQLRCHHCGAASPVPEACPECLSRSLLTRGLGTEQVEEALRDLLPGWPVYRVDSDTTARRGALQSLLEQINRGRPCFLLGTQMLAKGHHFPGVSLVVVLDADALLFSADFRGEERMAQLLTQVAGRAGRAGLPGEVVLQSHYPDHPALQAMLQQDYGSQARRLLAERRERGLPPAGQLALVRTDSRDAARGEQFLVELRRRAEAALPAGCTLVGPLPAPLHRRAGLYRTQLLMNCRSRAAAQAGADLLVELADQLPGSRSCNWSLEIDPQELA